MHWAIAIPFMLCWVTALILVLFYNPNPLRPYREVISITHRISGVCMIVLPILVIFKRRREYKIHLYNIKSAWLWSLNDVKWLALMGLAAVSKRIRLPEQGKFNAAEKVNFMLVMVSCVAFILTGLIIWLQEMAWIAWLIHISFAVLVTPTMLGHIYMATINPDTRKGLTGMISGYVDRHWAKHHYALWYRERFEKDFNPREASSEVAHCPSHSAASQQPAPAPDPPRSSGASFLVRPFPANAKVTPSFVFQAKKPGTLPKTRQ